MNNRSKTIISIIVLTLLILTTFRDAVAETKKSTQRANTQLQTCVTEIGRHADYDEASKVVHWVTAFKERNLALTSIRIETTVYVNKDFALARQYTAACVTDSVGGLVRFRIDEAS